MVLGLGGYRSNPVNERLGILWFLKHLLYRTMGKNQPSREEEAMSDSCISELLPSSIKGLALLGYLSSVVWVYVNLSSVEGYGELLAGQAQNLFPLGAVVYFGNHDAGSAAESHFRPWGK